MIVKSRILLYLMAIFYIVAGINHLINPQFYLKIMPRYIPYHAAMVLISGVFEALLGVLLFSSITRPYAAWGIIILLIAIFPANIQMALDWQAGGHVHLWIAYLRLPLQLLLIWWAYRYTKENKKTT